VVAAATGKTVVAFISQRPLTLVWMVNDYPVAGATVEGGEEKRRTYNNLNRRCGDEE
jgi:hypothetical protein